MLTVANMDPPSYINTMNRTTVVRPRRETPILVCKKCMKRSPDGAKIYRRLKRELKSTGNGTKKAPRLVTTGCFKICPKSAVVLASAQTLAQGEYVLVARRGDTEAAMSLLFAD
jgi:predicted metal-binding protein